MRDRGPGLRLRVVPVRIVPVAVGVAVLALLGMPPMAAAADGPLAGQCFDLSDEQVQAAAWPVTDAVPCTERHTVEVTEVGVIPAGADPEEFADEQCGALDVWTAVGVNVPVAGIVRDPVRIAPAAFVVRGAPVRYACAAAAVAYDGDPVPTVVPLRAPLDRLGPRARAALRVCVAAGDARPDPAALVTTGCSTRPRWQATTWVLWTAFYDRYPGRFELRQRARDLCGARAVVTLPTAAEWGAGPPFTWCFRRVA